jgi:antitoxin (DNA-binding transcriptional repressor) of toxin-antitoxin stability system
VKTVELEQLHPEVQDCIEAAQGDGFLVTRSGRPAAVILGVQGLDAEDIAWARDAAFWEMIEARRREPTVSRAELDERIEQAVASREPVR